MIRSARERKLDALFAKTEAVPVEEVLTILFMSLDELLTERRTDLRYYVQMLSEVTMSTERRALRIVSRYYDPTAELFISAFRKSVPELSS